MTNYLGVEYAKLIRLKSLGMSMIPVIGALSVSGDLFIRDFILLFFIGVLINATGFMLNDLIDRNRDEVSPDFEDRPMVQSILSPQLVSKLIVFFILITLITVILYFQNLLALLALIIGSGFGILYDIFGKKIYGSDILLASAFASFCLFGMLTQSGKLSSYNIILILLIFFQVLYFNVIEGGLKDAYNDRKTGAKTIAVKLEVRIIPEIKIPTKFKILALVLESIIFGLIISLFLFVTRIYEFRYWFITIIFLLIIGLSFNYTMFKMLNMKKFQRNIIRDMIGKQELKRYLIYLGLLTMITGFLWPVLLILIPVLWALVWMFIFKVMYHCPLPRTSRLL